MPCTVPDAFMFLRQGSFTVRNLRPREAEREVARERSEGARVCFLAWLAAEPACCRHIRVHSFIQSFTQRYVRGLAWVRRT